METKLFYVLDENGSPRIARDVLEFAEWIQANNDKRFIARTEIGIYTISTVFLGIDMSYEEKEDPTLWETGIYETINNKMHVITRYQSENAARKGHDTFVTILNRANGALVIPEFINKRKL